MQVLTKRKNIPSSNNAKKGINNNKKSNHLLDEIKDNKFVYLFILPGMIYYFIFAYAPMYGITLAFKEFMVGKGIIGSPWIGLTHFRNLMIEAEFWHAFKNTLRISVFKIITGFPAPIILAILFNEMAKGTYKKILQTVYTFPNFLSWVVVSGIMINFFSSTGIVNQVLSALGLKPYEFLADIKLIRPILYITGIWKSAGWSSIIYLAAISGINPELYEAAIVDGASRFQRIMHITWPGMKSTTIILFVLSVGGVMNAGFDQIFNLTNPVVRQATEIIDTYVYRITFGSGMFDYGFSTAVGLFKSVVNFILLVGANKVVKLFNEGGIF